MYTKTLDFLATLGLDLPKAIPAGSPEKLFLQILVLQHSHLASFICSACWPLRAAESETLEIFGKQCDNVTANVIEKVGECRPRLLVQNLWRAI